MATQTYQDFLGVGGTGTNPSSGLTPEQIAENERQRRIREQQAAVASVRSTNIASGRVAGNNVPFANAVAGGGYQEGKGFVDGPRSQQWRTPLDGIPGVGNTLGAVVQAPFKVAESVGKEAWNNPGRTFITGGTNLAVAGVDRAVDTLATGAVRDATGKPKATVNVPLTPAQLYDPNHPLYESGNGYSLNVPGIKDIGNGIAAGAHAVAGAFSGAGSGGNAQSPGAGGNPAALADAQRQANATSARGAAESAGMGANVARVQAIGQKYADEGAAAGAGLAAQGAASANRAAPQMTAPSSANQQAALNAAANFQANTSGVAGIRGATADTSGAGALSSFRGDTQGISNLDSFQANNTARGVAELRAFQPSNTQQGVERLEQFAPTEGLGGARDLTFFDPSFAESGIAGLKSHSTDGTERGARQLQDFRTSTSGINNLNAYANEAHGPPPPEPLVPSQSHQDKRTAIALARSARGGPAAIAQAMRQAQSEGAAIAAETRGQAAALSAQEFDTYKQRQLASLQAAGQLISNADAQRLQALSDAGQLLSNADQQRLAAFQSIAQARTAQDMQRVTALAQASQARTAADAQSLGARTAAGQLQSNMDQQRLGASTAAGQLQSNMDAQRLSASQSAGQLRLGNDTNRVNALNAAANINLEGSRINQQGQIAATQAELAGSAQKLQALSLQGQISSDIRSQDIDVLKSNLSASLQQMNLNDTQVRAFAQMGQDARIAGQNLNMQANQMGINAEAAQRQLALQWDQFAQSQLTDAQQLDLQNRQLAAGVVQNNEANRQRSEDRKYGLVGTGLIALGTATSDERAKKDIKPVNMAKALRDSPGSEYSYKDEKHGKGRFVGPMAQGLQKSKVFAGSVVDDKSGVLKVDSTRLVLTHHAALSHLQKEIDTLKRLKKAKKETRA